MSCNNNKYYKCYVTPPPRLKKGIIVRIAIVDTQKKERIIVT